TPLGNRALLEREDVAGAEDMEWWSAVDAGGGVKVTCVPARHFSERSVWDRNRALWGGFVISGAGGSAYFAGDTAWSPVFEEIRARFGAMRLAMLPIGAYRPQWFMESVHISPREAVRAQQLLGASTSIAVHFGTFPLADDGMLEPVRALEAELAKVSAR